MTWGERKAKQGCECTDADKLECCNFDAPDGPVSADGNETCGCPCHRAERTEAVSS